MTDDERLVEALRVVEEPERPVDGDCDPWSKWIALELHEAGIPAKVQLLFGMIPQPGVLPGSTAVPLVIVYGHACVLVGTTTIVDFTARQFHPNLPARWITTVDDYKATLARVTMVQEIVLL